MRVYKLEVINETGTEQVGGTYMKLKLLNLACIPTSLCSFMCESTIEN